jgi:hypothetical protein
VETDKFTAAKVPRQCPLVLLVNVRCREGKAFESVDGREMKTGARREDEHSIRIRKLEALVNNI